MTLIQQLKAILADCSDLDLGRVVLPLDDTDLREQRRLDSLARIQYFTRAARIADAIAPAVGETLRATTAEAALDIGGRPDITSWVWRARSGLQDGKYVDSAGLRMELNGHLYGDFGDVLGLGGVPDSDQCTYIDWPGAGRLSFDGSPRLRRLELASGFAVVQSSDRLVTSLPSEQEPVESAYPEVHDRWLSAVDDAMSFLAAEWPIGEAALRHTVRALGRLHGKGGLRALNYSVHAARGLIMLSPRPGYMTAQSLAHEGAHNRVSSILDCFDVFKNPSTIGWSSFVGADRPLGHILHGAVSFANDVHVALAGRERFDPVEADRIDRYVRLHSGRLDNALKELRRIAVPTTHGRRLLDGLEAAVAHVATRV